jgi:hypothetical protein
VDFVDSLGQVAHLFLEDLVGLDVFCGRNGGSLSWGSLLFGSLLLFKFTVLLLFLYYLDWNLILDLGGKHFLKFLL